MITFQELRITPDGQKLIIDARVLDLPYYNEVYIDSVYIDTQDTYSDTNPHHNPVYSKQIEGNNKKIRLELTNADFLESLKDNLFFVYIVTKGTPSFDTPCTMDEKTTLGVTLWTCPLYNAIMSNIKDLENNCDVPKHFIDILLQFKAFKISVESEHYIQAIKYYNKFIKRIDINTNINKCNCYG